MILKTIEPLNFGPFAHATKLFIDPEVTVLTGPNDTGKSNVLKLIHLICNRSPAEEKDYNHDRIGKTPNPWHSDTEFGCTLSAIVTENSLQYFSQMGLMQAKDEIFVFIGLAPNNRSLQITRVNRDGVKINIPHFLTLNALPQVKMLPLSSEIRDTINFKDLNVAESNLIKLGFGKEFTYAHYSSFSVGRRTQQVASAEKKLNTMLKRILPDTLGLEFLLREVGDTPEFLTVSLFDRHGGFAPLGSRGTGVRRLLNVMGILLTLDMSQQNYILYDEPETALHADSQHLLRQLLEELARSESIQVIYATHSPSMINTIRPGAIRVLSRHEKNEIATTKIENVAFEDNYIRVRSSLGLTPSDSLLYAPVTIIVEGPTEVRCLPAVFQKLQESGVSGFDDFKLLLSNVHFLDGNGDNYSRILKVARSQNVASILFLDGDKRNKINEFKKEFADVPIVFLPDQSEFEEVVPRADYIRALAEFLDVDSSKMSVSNFNAWLKTEKKIRAFSKLIDRWLQDVFDIEKDYKKPLVMEAAISLTSSNDIQRSAFEELIQYVRYLLRAN